MDAHYFLIGTDGRHYGPLSQDDVLTWLADGRASRYSRARRTEESEWSALRDMPEFEEVTRPPYAAWTPPPLPDAAPANGPSPAPAGADGQRRLDPVSCLRRGWTLLFSDFALLAGTSLGVTLLAALLAMIPTVGLPISALVNNVLMAGVYLLFISRIRGLRTGISEVAVSIRDVIPQVIIAGLVQPLLAGTIVVLLSRPSQAAVAVGAVAALPCVFLLVCYVFLVPLIVDRRLGVWTAMERCRKTVQRTWFPTFGLMLAVGLLLLLVARFLVPLALVALPYCWAVLMVAYEDLFGE
ncbi:MAG: hypothetical protein AB7H96_03480 [Vicinamibacterales bacterium]